MHDKKKKIVNDGLSLYIILLLYYIILILILIL